MRFRHFLPLLALFFVAAAKKPQVAVRFHLQANEKDGAPFVMRLPLANAPGPAFVKKIPEVSERDIVAVYPFPAPDGTMGCAFKLDDHGRIGLDTLSVESRGKVLVCMVNLRVVTAMLIDKRVSDGIIVVPSGLLPQEITMLREKFRLIGQPNGKPLKAGKKS